MLSMVADWRPGRNRFAGISIQQYDRSARRLTGDEHMIFKGTAAQLTEGPNLYQINGWYYLVTAEGGTSWQHQVTVARSRELLGPYEPDPAGPMLTSVNRPDLPLQKAGHGSLVETPSGEWFLAHLVGRPYTPRGRCVLGRETAIQRVEWSPDGWPRIHNGIPAIDVPGPGALPTSPDDLPGPGAAPAGFADVPGPGFDFAESSVAGEEADEFDSGELGPNWSTLRRPATPDWADLAARPGFLRIHGGQSAAGHQRPSLVARRVTAFRCELETLLEFEPRNYRQLAGLTAYYNSRNWYYLHVTADDDGRPVLDLLACDNGRVRVVPGVRRPLTGGLSVGLRARFDGPAVTFAWSGRPGTWHDAGPALDATTLSDEYAAQVADGEPEAWGFTGAFLGLWVQDLGAEHGYADFDRATYRSW
jgi:xylan 1,4-beta-xylosidase